MFLVLHLLGEDNNLFSNANNKEMSCYLLKYSLALSISSPAFEDCPRL